jgi:amino acid adenylation domain-containing protein
MCAIRIPRSPHCKQNNIAELFTREATTSPRNVALVAGLDSLTYAELEFRSNRIANNLQSLGVSPDVVVAICMSRSLESIVAALGVLKAGGAYLPLDPECPVDRLAFMLNDAKPGVLLANGCIAGGLSAGPWQTLAADVPAITGCPSATPHIDLSPRNLAYVIYTSGSTGHPKGVEVSHLSLLNLVHWHQSAFGVTSADRATHLASVGFDASVWELWPYLTAGASVFVVDEEVRRRPESLRDWLIAHEITISFVPTALCEELIKLKWPDKTKLRFLLTGADRLNHYPPANLPFQLVNNYGPTECAVVATSAPVFSDHRPDRVPPIGRPIDNTQVHILDHDLDPVPFGEAGEIHIGGLGLARGYRNRPDLTAEKFIPNPFSTELGSRLYKTGDIGRWLPDGEVAFLGRMDEQLKIRGYRVEPAEIVAVLNQHPLVRASSVVADDSAGDRRLIAYIVPPSGIQPTDATLREHARTQLPEYMVPAVFVLLPELPLGSNGKLNRAALPDISEANILRDNVYAPPRTPVEERIAGIVAPLLHLERVGVNDNFFLLGGNSLLGTQLITRLVDTFDIALSLRNIFDNPTIRELSAQVEQLIHEKVAAMGEHEIQCLLSQMETGGEA